jgi:hypothetical protein
MASLSPENYGIAMRTDENEFDRIGGMEVSDFLDQPSE